MQYEANERQVDCIIDTYNNAVCVSRGESMPRKGAYVPSAGAIITNEIFVSPWGELLPVVVVFKVWLDEEKRPSKGLTELHYTLFQDWPAGQSYVEVDRPDQIGPYCTAYIETSLSKQIEPAGRQPDAENGRQLLRNLSRKSEQRASLAAEVR